MKFAISFFVLLVSGQVSLACTDVTPWYVIDDRVQVNEDCSFSGSGYRDYDISAGPGVDIGGGRIAQRLSFSGTCIYSISEALRVLDCQSMEAIDITGQPPAEFAQKMRAEGTQPDQVYNVEQDVSNLYPPVGQVTLTPATTIDELVHVSERARYSFTTEVVSNIGKMSKRNRYDPFCACRVFYPNSNASKNEPKG